jgi:hypothetical protein
MGGQSPVTTTVVVLSDSMPSDDTPDAVSPTNRVANNSIVRAVVQIGITIILTAVLGPVAIGAGFASAAAAVTGGGRCGRESGHRHQAVRW